MSITDELREAARTHSNKELYVAIEADDLFDIANHIDEEHDRTIKDLSDTLHRQEKKLEHLQNGYGSMSCEHTQTIIELSNAYDQIDRLKKVNDELRHQRNILSHKKAIAAGNCESNYKLAVRLQELVLELYEECNECDRWKYRDRMHNLGIDTED